MNPQSFTIERFRSGTDWICRQETELWQDQLVIKRRRPNPTLLCVHTSLGYPSINAHRKASNGKLFKEEDEYSMNYVSCPLKIYSMGLFENHSLKQVDIGNVIEK